MSVSDTASLFTRMCDLIPDSAILRDAFPLHLRDLRHSQIPVYPLNTLLVTIFRSHSGYESRYSEVKHTDIIPSVTMMWNWRWTQGLQSFEPRDIEALFAPPENSDPGRWAILKTRDSERVRDGHLHLRKGPSKQTGSRSGNSKCRTLLRQVLCTRRRHFHRSHVIVHTIEVLTS